MGDDINEVLVFTRCFENESPYGGGVSSLDLRRLIRMLGPVSDLFALIQASDIDTLETQIVDRFLETLPLIESIDRALRVPVQNTQAIVQDALEERVSRVLDEILTASVQRIPRDLHTKSVQARILREEHEDSYHTWQNARESLMALRRKLELVVADLAHAYKKRGDLDEPMRLQEETFATARALEEKLDCCETRCVELENELHLLQEKTLPLIELATSVIHKINRLRVAAATLMVETSGNLNDQMSEQIERLKHTLAHIEDNFSELQRIDRDPTFVSALDELKLLEATAKQILTPIRPSVFVQPLDRPDELRRLALIALCVYTDRPDSFNPKSRHRGIGRKTVAEILVLADIVDKNEFEIVSQAVFDFQIKGCGLAEKENLRGNWLFRTTQAGIDQVNMWLDETLNRDHVKTCLETAIEQRRQLHKDSRPSFVRPGWKKA